MPRVKRLITWVDETLAEAVEQCAALSGESANAYVTRLLRSAVEGRESWKREALAAGRLANRGSVSAARPSAVVVTPIGYASSLVSSERDERLSV